MALIGRQSWTIYSFSCAYMPRTTASAVRMEPEVMQAGASPGALQRTQLRREDWSWSLVWAGASPRVCWRASVWLGRLEANHFIFLSIASAQFVSFPAFVQLLVHVWKPFQCIPPRSLTLLKMNFSSFFLSASSRFFSVLCSMQFCLYLYQI